MSLLDFNTYKPNYIGKPVEAIGNYFQEAGQQRNRIVDSASALDIALSNLDIDAGDVGAQQLKDEQYGRFKSGVQQVIDTDSPTVGNAIIKKLSRDFVTNAGLKQAVENKQLVDQERASLKSRFEKGDISQEGYNYAIRKPAHQTVKTDDGFYSKYIPDNVVDLFDFDTALSAYGSKFRETVERNTSNYRRNPDGTIAVDLNGNPIGTNQLEERYKNADMLAEGLRETIKGDAAAYASAVQEASYQDIDVDTFIDNKIDPILKRESGRTTADLGQLYKGTRPSGSGGSGGSNGDTYTKVFGNAIDSGIDLNKYRKESSANILSLKNRESRFNEKYKIVDGEVDLSNMNEQDKRTFKTELKALNADRVRANTYNSFLNRIMSNNNIDIKHDLNKHIDNFRSSNITNNPNIDDELLNKYKTSIGILKEYNDLIGDGIRNGKNFNEVLNEIIEDKYGDTSSILGAFSDKYPILNTTIAIAHNVKDISNPLYKSEIKQPFKYIMEKEYNRIQDNLNNKIAEVGKDGFKREFTTMSTNKKTDKLYDLEETFMKGIDNKSINFETMTGESLMNPNIRDEVYAKDVESRDLSFVGIDKGEPLWKLTINKEDSDEPINYFGGFNLSKDDTYSLAREMFSKGEENMGYAILGSNLQGSDMVGTLSDQVKLRNMSQWVNGQSNGLTFNVHNNDKIEEVGSNATPLITTDSKGFKHKIYARKNYDGTLDIYESSDLKNDKDIPKFIKNISKVEDIYVLLGKRYNQK